MKKISELTKDKIIDLVANNPTSAVRYIDELRAQNKELLKTLQIAFDALLLNEDDESGEARLLIDNVLQKARGEK